MLIDEVKIRVSAGNGGKGAVAFNKNLKSLGPAGGSGGSGASVYLEGASNLNALSQFRYEKDIKAKDGEDGRSQFRDGRDGSDLVLKVPVGTVINILDEKKVSTTKTLEILKIGERVLIARGGHGGKGNFLFRSPKLTTPLRFQDGLLGEHFALYLELKLIADIGLIGLPNAGKTSLLNELTNSQSKVANYAFTTLEPNLGSYYELILADIPGLIEGASAGKGLGIKFLRHIERTKILFHLISAESLNFKKDYGTIRNELKFFSKELIKKTEYVFLTKSDTLSAKETKKKVAELKKLNKNVFPVSIHDWNSIEKVKKILNKIQAGKYTSAVTLFVPKSIP